MRKPWTRTRRTPSTAAQNAVRMFRRVKVERGRIGRGGPKGRSVPTRSADHPTAAARRPQGATDRPTWRRRAGCEYCQRMRASPPADALAPVPFYDLDPAHAPLKEKIVADFADLVTSGAFTNGPHVAAFEAAFAEYVGAPRCVGLASGLDALRLGLIAAGVERGDEVLVPANTFIATFEAIGQAGARACARGRSGGRPQRRRRRCSRPRSRRRRRAFVPVHLYGQLADMRELTRIGCRARALDRRGRVPGARRRARRHRRRHESGVAGGLQLLSGQEPRRVRRRRRPGHDGRGPRRARPARCASTGSARSTPRATRATRPGSTRVQALVLLHKLPLLDDWNRQRAAVARRLRRAPRRRRRSPPPARAGRKRARLAPLRRCARRSADALASYLRERGIGTGLSLSRAAPSLGGLRRRSGIAPAHSRSPSARRTRCSRCRSSRA